MISDLRLKYVTNILYDFIKINLNYINKSNFSFRSGPLSKLMAISGPTLIDITNYLSELF